MAKEAKASRILLRLRYRGGMGRHRPAATGKNYGAMKRACRKQVTFEHRVGENRRNVA